MIRDEGRLTGDLEHGSPAGSDGNRSSEQRSRRHGAQRNDTRGPSALAVRPRAMDDMPRSLPCRVLVDSAFSPRFRVWQCFTAFVA